MKMFHLAANLELPTEAVTQTFALLGRRGSGKTNTAVDLAEEMIAGGFPIVILDPVGVWWGLRSHFGVARLGGEHADIPLDQASGKVVAEFVVADRVPVLLDVSQFGEGAMKRFVGEFLQRLYEINREALHVFIDEADEFAPQTDLGGNTAACLGAMQRVVRRGRARGLGVTLITQRSAVLNKSVLTQTECLIAMQTTAPQDLKAIDDWLKYHGTAEEREKIMRDLPAMQRGEAWVYSPGWLKTLKRVVFRPRKSFDSSRTPKPGERRTAPKSLAEVDLAALTKQLAATIEKAAADDPRELRRRIVELEREKRGEGGKTDQAAIERAVARAVAAEAARHEAVHKTNEHTLLRMQQQMRKAAELLEVNGEVNIQVAIEQAAISKNRVVSTQSPEKRTNYAQKYREHGQPGQGVRKPQQRMLDALAWWEAVGVPRPTRYQVGIVARVNATGGYFDNTIGPLATGGYVDRTSGHFSLTAAGWKLASLPEGVTSLEGYHTLIRTVIKKGPTIRMFDAITAHGTEPLSRDELGAAAGVNPAGGYFDNSIGPLSTLGLIERRAGQIIPTDLMFPEGLR